MGLPGEAVVIQLVALDDALAPALIELLSTLSPPRPLRVAFDAAGLYDAPEGARVVLVAPERSARALNLHRPVVRTRHLQLLLWCTAQGAFELKGSAPDMNSWVSHRLHLPSAWPPRVAEALDAARDLGEALILLGMARPAPGFTLLPAGVDSAPLAAALDKGPVWLTDAENDSEVLTALAVWAERGKHGLVLHDPAVVIEGVRVLDAAPTPWAEAAAACAARAGADADADAGVLAARLGLDPAALGMPGAPRPRVESPPFQALLRRLHAGERPADVAEALGLPQLAARWRAGVSAAASPVAAPPAGATLRVLHLSDLHERVDLDWLPRDRKLRIRLGRAKRHRVLGPALTERLDAIVKERRPDLLVFTGDLADWGLPEEYLAAERRLHEVAKRLGLTWDRVFFVPGNHDIQRTIDAPSWARLRRFAANPRHHDALSRWLAGGRRPQGAPKDGLDLPAKRQSGYRAFLERIKRPELLPDDSRGHPVLGYRQTLALPGLPPVHVIGLDTAWLAGDDNDKGRLLLTEHQVLLNATNPDDGKPLNGLRLALMHHPLGELGDEALAHRLLSDHVDIVLHGHQRSPVSQEESNHDGALRTLAAGSLYEGDEEDRWVNSFHVLDVVMNAEGRPLRYVVQFYAWSIDGGHWHPHAALYKNAPLGRLVWETPLKFVGRETQLAALAAALFPPSGQAQAAVVCNLQGMAGVGKSFLIERFYADHLPSFPGGHLKITLGHDAAPTANALIGELAERLGVSQGPGRIEDRVRGAALATRPLLHIDNLDSEAQAQAAVALVRRLPGVPIVLSGRYHFGRATPGWWLVSIEPFSVSEALAQLQAELVAEVAARVDDAARRTLVGALGGLPLAIHLAASYLNAGYEVRDFLAALEQSCLSLTPFTVSETAYLDRAERTLHATFELSLKALRVELGAEAEAGLSAVAALGVAPLTGARVGWLAAIMGVDVVQAEDWLDKALGLSIVQHDGATGRWRVHKLFAEHLRQHTDADAATARMDAWALARLQEAPDDTRGARWGALQAEHEAVAEWVTGLDGVRAVLGGRVGYDYAFVSGPYAAWLGAVARGLDATADAAARSALLWRQANLARQAGDLDLAVSAAEAKGAHGAVQGWDREVALSAGLRADVLQARGQLDEALRIRREEQLPVYERLGDVREKAVTIGKIADVLQARGQLDEALRIRREEELPVYERLGDVREKAVTMGQIADVLQARGQLDEAMRIRREEELPVYERLGDMRGKAVTMGKIADVLQARGHLDEALRIRRDEQIPVYERLGDVHSKAVTMGKIADVLQDQGQLDEALRIRREEELPIYERLGDVRSKAATMGKIADVLQARGQFDEALRILQEEVLPITEALGDRRGLLVDQTNLAITLLLTRKPRHIPEAITLLSTALKSAVDLNLPVEAEYIRGLFRQLGLPPPQ
ncbi:tetratricopeptide repeat protein [Myxococcota bacterium]|nr:tetratricopeptide repeat protein [Myxococcota bacterium]